MKCPNCGKEITSYEIKKLESKIRDYEIMIDADREQSKEMRIENFKLRSRIAELEGKEK